jgi:subtilisin family serine protease
MAPGGVGLPSTQGGAAVRPSAFRFRPRPRGRRVVLIALVLFTIAVLSTVAGAGAAPAPDGARAAPAGPAGLLGRGTAVTGGSLDTALVGLWRVQAREGWAAARRHAASRGLDVRDGRVRVILLAREAGAGALLPVRRAVADAGGSVRLAFAGMAQAWVPVRELRSLAASPGIAEVRAPGGRAVDAVVGEGVAETAVAAWQAAGFTGRGVKVGIIDFGFSGYQALLGTELPATVTTWGRSVLGPEGGPGDSEPHGTGVAEVVHEMAPGARLYLAMVDDPVELGLAERWMVEQGVKVINHSCGWYGWSSNAGTGVIDDVVNHAVGAGVFWVNSAGNYRRQHWMGDFTDANGDHWLDFDGVAGHSYNTFYVSQAGRVVEGCLWWDDSWSAAAEDYDLHLCRYDPATGGGTIVASSMRRQSGTAGGPAPVEFLTYTVAEPGYYAWAVARAWAARTDVDFDLLTVGSTLDHPSNPCPHYYHHARSCAVPAANPSAGFVAVAAVERAPGFAQAVYSSQGPTRDGRVTPEVSAPTAVGNVTYGTFTGTSASSPHVAGVAAVLRQAYPSYTPAQVEDLVKANAIDLGDAGPDTLFGWGRLELRPVPTDTTRPVTRAYATSVKRGGVAALPYKVIDNGFSAGPAKVTIVLRNSAGKVVKTLGPAAGKPMCVLLNWKFRCWLARGTYRFTVKAVDAAGLRASSVGSAKLAVK